MRNLAEFIAALRQSRLGRAEDAIHDVCLACGADLRRSDAYRRLRVCGACRFHYTLGARERIDLLVDPGTFRETNRTLISIDPIAFREGYTQRLSDDERRTGLADAIVTGSARVGGRDVALAVIDVRFLGGTIGSVVGEKLTRAMERAARRRRPLIAVIASGGVRLQEGPLALLQAGKIALARQRLARARMPFLCVLTNPTLGAAYTGIAASADYAVAEPGALIGYSAGRSTEYGDEQTAEEMLARGLVDEVADRGQLRDLLLHVLDALSAGGRVDAAEPGETVRPKHEHGQAWNKVQIARNRQRPTALDYIGRMASTYVELRGDRAGADAETVTCGIATLAGEPVMIVGQQRRPSGDAQDGGWIGPAGFRKAVRAIQLACRFSLPIITLIDTPGADPRPAASADGLGPAMAACTAAMAEATSPTIAAVIGQGGSEAAAAFGITDRVLMLEHAIYTAIPPEQAAVLLHRDASRAGEVADALHLTADACLQLKVIDGVVPEPPGGAHTDHEAAARSLRAALLRTLAETQAIPAGKRQRMRYRRYRAIGVYGNYIGTTLADEVGDLRDAITRRAGAALRLRRRSGRQPPDTRAPEANASGLPAAHG
jgi:acetyl-CoA carboxylase carboxyl transferase alpha subunit/acetyl-CoA carboxylase carboxyl transferase beta subunit